MRWILTLLVTASLGLPGAALARGQDAGVIETAVDQYDSYYAAVLRVGRCKVIVLEDYDPGDDDFQDDKSSWSGACDANGLADGPGLLRLCVFSNTPGFFDRCEEYEGALRNGLLQGRVHSRFQQLRRLDPGRSDEAPLVAWYEFKDGCVVNDVDRNDTPCDLDLGAKVQARYLAGASDGERAVAGGQSDDNDHGIVAGQQCARLAEIVNSPAPTIGALASLTHTVAVLKASIAMIDQPCGKPWIVSTDRAAIARQRAELYGAWKKARAGCLQLTSGVSSEGDIASLDDSNPCKEVVRAE